MESQAESLVLRAALDWQVELGADEAICDAPVNRFEANVPQNPPVARAAEPSATADDAIAAARLAAGSASDLRALAGALADYRHCELWRGARNTVFSDGNADARVMVIGEAPGRDEDIQGLPFVGPAGRLLDMMFAAIGLGRQAAQGKDAIYITNILPWRPPQNRDPDPSEVAMMLPFVERHVALADPEFIVLMGNISCQAMLGRRGITRLRGRWATVLGRPALPMFHPAYLLRNPAAKREAWADLLELRARLGDGK